jgi:CBS domain-containing protein
MQVSDMKTRNVAWIEDTASAAKAAEMMRTRHVGSLVAVKQPNGERVPVGMLTDRDIVLALAATHTDPALVSVADVMTRDVVTCTETQDIFDAIDLMSRHGVRRLPVVNTKGALTGIVTADDIVGAVGTLMAELGKALAHGTTVEMTRRR